MKVHVVLYRYTTYDHDGFDVIGVYHDINKARLEMARHMEEAYQRNVEYYGDRFSEDFAQNYGDYISFGFYGDGLEPDHVWECHIETMEVE